MKAKYRWRMIILLINKENFFFAPKTSGFNFGYSTIYHRAFYWLIKTFLKFNAEYLKNWKITTWSISNRFEVELTITNDWTSRIVLHWSTSVLLDTSYILFYQIYWYYLKMERNLFQFLSLIFPDSGSLKLAVRLRKKKSKQPFFSDVFEGLFLGGQAPSTAPILRCVNLTIWTKSLLFGQKNFSIRTKTKTKEDMIFKSSRAFKILTH